MYKEINNCRVCGNTTLINIVDLGEQCLSGVFPNTLEITVPKGPLELVKCHGNTDCCNLVQLKQSYYPSMLYGENYGYRSSLNSSMAKHLQNKVKKILDMDLLKKGDLIIDVGSNDGTTLKFYPTEYTLVGVDPVGNKFKEYYSKHIDLVADFFNYETMNNLYPNKKAKVITSFSMFYDLESPLQFMQDVNNLLADDGIWVFEQSYLPTMLKQNSFDTICHEHLEYYSLYTIHWMCKKIGFKIIDIDFNKVNGGSISITVAKLKSPLNECTDKINSILSNEQEFGINTLIPYELFKKNIHKIKIEIDNFFTYVKLNKLTVFGLGASTKGNVILQYCNIDPSKMAYIGEVNHDKFGCYTPGTNIPIIEEHKILSKQFDYLFVLPWHFRDFFEMNPNYTPYRNKMVYPLPKFIIPANNYSQTLVE